ncbi:hypothetical protein OSTOST_15715, partial [Ostertagia ostertagi]
MWYGQRLKFAMLIQVLPGFTIPFYILTNDVRLQRTPSGGLVPAIVDKKVTASYFTAAGIWMAAHCLFLVVAYCYLFIVIRKRHEAQLKVGSRNLKKDGGTWAQRDRFKEMSKRREFRLFLMASSI